MDRKGTKTGFLIQKSTKITFLKMHFWSKENALKLKERNFQIPNINISISDVKFKRSNLKHIYPAFNKFKASKKLFLKVPKIVFSLLIPKFHKNNFETN